MSTLQAMHPREALAALLLSQPLSLRDEVRATWHDHLSALAADCPPGGARGFHLALTQTISTVPVWVLADLIAGYGGHLPATYDRASHLSALADAYLGQPNG